MGRIFDHFYREKTGKLDLSNRSSEICTSYRSTSVLLVDALVLVVFDSKISSLYGVLLFFAVFFPLFSLKLHICAGNDVTLEPF